MKTAIAHPWLGQVERWLGEPGEKANRHSQHGHNRHIGQ